jgi:hypothetical protein
LDKGAKFLVNGTVVNDTNAIPEQSIPWIQFQPAKDATVYFFHLNLCNLFQGEWCFSINAVATEGNVNSDDFLM